MEPIRIISLTPDLSGVLRVTYLTKPLQRLFLVAGEAVETATNLLGALSTWLKPGVDDTGTSLVTPRL
jgi:hypothetical protein